MPFRKHARFTLENAARSSSRSTTRSTTS
nr:DUF2961 domain-containing protein [Bradyrhizobium genosp. SA-3]